MPNYYPEQKILNNLFSVMGEKFQFFLLGIVILYIFLSSIKLSENKLPFLLCKICVQIHRQMIKKDIFWKLLTCKIKHFGPIICPLLNCCAMSCTFSFLFFFCHQTIYANLYANLLLLSNYYTALDLPFSL